MNAAAETLLRAGKWQDFNQQFGGAAVDLSNARLAGANLSQTRLVGANLDGADLTGAQLRNTDLRRSSLRGTRLDRASFTHANLGAARLVDLAAEDVVMDQCSLSGVELSRLRGARWKLTHCTLRGARLDDVAFTEGRFDTLNLSECKGTQLHLGGPTADRIDLAGSELLALEWAIIAGEGLDLDGAQLGRLTANNALLGKVTMRGTQLGELAGHESALVDSELLGSRVERLRLTRCLIGSPAAIWRISVPRYDQYPLAPKAMRTSAVPTAAVVSRKRTLAHSPQAFMCERILARSAGVADSRKPTLRSTPCLPQ